MTYPNLEYSISGFKIKIKDILKKVLTDDAKSRYDKGILSRNNVNINDIKPEAQTEAILGKIETKLANGVDQRKTDEYQLLRGVRDQIESKVYPHKKQQLQKQANDRPKFYNVNDSNMTLSQLLNNGQDKAQTITASQVDRKVQFNGGATTYGNRTVKAELDTNKNNIVQSTHVVYVGELDNNTNYPEELRKILEDNEGRLENNGDFYENMSGARFYQTGVEVKSMQYRLNKRTSVPTFYKYDQNGKDQYREEKSDGSNTRDNTEQQQNVSQVGDDEYVYDNKNNKSQFKISYVQQGEGNYQSEESSQYNAMNQARINEDSEEQQIDDKSERSVDFVKAQLSNEVDENIELRKQLKELRERHNNLQAKQQDYDTKYNEWKTAVLNASEFEQQKGMLEKQIDELKIRIQQLESGVEKAEEDKDKVEGQNTALTQENIEKDMRIGKLQQEINNIKKQNEELTIVNKAQQGNIEFLKKQNDELNEQKQGKADNRKKQTGSSSRLTTVSERERGIVASRTNKKTSMAVISKQQETISSQQETINKQQKTINDQQETIKGLGNTVSNQQDTINKLQRNVLQKDDEIVKLRKSKKKLEQSKADLKKENQRLKEEVKRLREENGELNQKNQQLQNQQKKQMEKAADEIHDLEELVGTQRVTIQDVTQENKELKQINEELKQVNEELEQNILQMKHNNGAGMGDDLQ